MFHGGIDYAAPLGTPIPAVTGGTVVFSGVSGSLTSGFGNTVIVKGVDAAGQALYTLYAHLSTGSMLPRGSVVSPGQIIGKVGNTGSSTGPHLHFGVVTAENAAFMNESGLGGIFTSKPPDPSTFWANPDSFNFWPAGTRLSSAASFLMEYEGPMTWIDIAHIDDLLLGGYYMQGSLELSLDEILDYLTVRTGFGSGWSISTHASGHTIRPPKDAVGSLADLLGDIGSMSLATDIMRFREQILFQEWGMPSDTVLASEPSPGGESAAMDLPPAAGAGSDAGLALAWSSAPPTPAATGPIPHDTTPRLEALLIESMASFGVAGAGGASGPPAPAYDARVYGLLAVATA